MEESLSSSHRPSVPVCQQEGTGRAGSEPIALGAALCGPGTRAEVAIRGQAQEQDRECGEQQPGPCAAPGSGRAQPPPPGPNLRRHRDPVWGTRDGSGPFSCLLRGSNSAFVRVRVFVCLFGIFFSFSFCFFFFCSPQMDIKIAAFPSSSVCAEGICLRCQPVFSIKHTWKRYRG